MILWRKQSVPSGPTDLEAAGETIRRLQARVLDLELQALSDMAIRGQLRDASGRFVSVKYFERAA